MNQLSFYYVRNILFYNTVDSVNMDMLGFGSLARSQGIVHNRKYWTELFVTVEANASPILLNVM